MYDNQLLQTFYHANCGGYTSDGEILTGRQAPQPLKGVSCNACTYTDNACWQATVPNKTIDNFVHKNSKIKEPIIAIKVEQRKSAPKQTPKSAVKTVADLRFVGTHHSVVLSCSLFRKEVGASQLKTCKIDKIAKNSSDKSFTFSGCGLGHGVGMCQEGAKGLAQKQYSYRNILKHYFPGSNLVVL